MFAGQHRSVGSYIQNRKPGDGISNNPSSTSAFPARLKNNISCLDTDVERITGADSKSPTQWARQNYLSFCGYLGLHGKTILPEFDPPCNRFCCRSCSIYLRGRVAFADCRRPPPSNQKPGLLGTPDAPALRYMAIRLLRRSGHGSCGKERLPSRRSIRPRAMGPWRRSSLRNG